MALPQNLTTNEVKTAAGAEIEYSRMGVLPSNPNSVKFGYAGASPANPVSMYVAHEESGSGVSLVRRSICNFERTIAGQVDATKLIKIRWYTVAIIPIGQLTAMTFPTEVAANSNSFMSTTGAGTTVLFDGTGYGTAALLAGTT